MMSFEKFVSHLIVEMTKRTGLDLVEYEDHLEEFYSAYKEGLPIDLIVTEYISIHDLTDLRGEVWYA